MVLKYNRTGSYPLMNLAEDFSVPAALVWQAAWAMKKYVLAQELSECDRTAVLVLRELMGTYEYDRFYSKLYPMMGTFVQLQGSAL